MWINSLAHSLFFSAQALSLMTHNMQMISCTRRGCCQQWGKIFSLSQRREGNTLFPGPLSNQSACATTWKRVEPYNKSVYRPSLWYTDHPYDIPTIPMVYRPSLWYTDHPYDIPTIPMVYRPPLWYTDHPYDIPPKLVSKARLFLLLLSFSMPDRVLKPGDWNSRNNNRPYRPVIGFNSNTPRASLDMASRRMLG